METIWIVGNNIILSIQSIGQWQLLFMRFFSFLGSEEFFLLVAPVVLWCFDMVLGLRLGLLLNISAAINAMVKLLFHMPRPFWYSSKIIPLAEETSFGLPSGHAQNSIVVWGTLAFYIKKTWAWIVAILIVFLISYSRIYLGVHFPTDVLAGWIIGIILLVLWFWLEKPFLVWFNKFNGGIQVLIAFTGALLIILLGWIVQASIGDWNLPASWIENSHIAFPKSETINPYKLSGIISNAGAFFGLAVGGIWVFANGGFNAKGVWWKRILRFLLGVSVTLILWFGLGQVFPRGEEFLPYVLRFFRYSLLGFWITGFAPWLFIRLNLAETLSHK